MIPLLQVLGAAEAAASVSFITHSHDATTQTTRTYAAASVGAAASNRTVIVALSLISGTAVTALTIGGVSATVRLAAWDGTFAGVVIATAALPTGTTADVVVTTSASSTACTLGVWAAYGTLTYSANASNTAGNAATLTAPADALTIAAYAATNDGATALSGVTQRYGLASLPRYLGGDGRPGAGSHSVNAGPAPNFFSTLGVVDFSLT